jgi:hypothetical protein
MLRLGDGPDTSLWVSICVIICIFASLWRLWYALSNRTREVCLCVAKKWELAHSGSGIGGSLFLYTNLTGVVHRLRLSEEKGLPR